ncbi:hypothetical protein KSP40_PGU015775 [Platanthera guangdongensis]|uniref:NPR1/NIM1-like C-terminal domain-containing protein n=1 Tax=Platanthera guangdongensis TaxID=2320717 RepID=A0ABR2M0P4_9ASPA
MFLTVALAKMLFPREAKVAMDIARVEGTMEFTLCTIANQRSTVDLNKKPNYEEHLARIKALSRTGNPTAISYNLLCLTLKLRLLETLFKLNPLALKICPFSTPSLLFVMVVVIC